MKALSWFACLALFLAISASRVNAEENSLEQCFDREVCPIPYVRLAKQETEPFLFHGRVVDEDHPQYRNFRRALRHYTDVRACLVKSERSAMHPDLRQVDWHGLRDGRKINLCIFRIASSIETVEGIEAWFRSQEFRVGERFRTFSDKYVPRSQTEPVSAISAYLTYEQVQQIYGSNIWLFILKSFFEWLTGNDLSRGSTFIVYFSQSGQVVDVGAGGNSITN